MNTALWIIQFLLAAAFLFVGISKLIQPKEKLATMMAWVEDFSPTQIKLIGLAETLGAIGIIVPALTNIVSSVTPVAAGGLVLVMVGAILTHLRRREYPNIVANMLLLAFAAFVVYGRLAAVPL